MKDAILEGKTVILGVSGSIAAYKIANLTSMLTKRGCDVHVLMTKNATKFINPITFETLTGHKCLVDTFDRNFEFNIEHVALGKRADVVLVAPASANIISKMANGLADDMLSTTILACTCRKLVAPAMNTNMYENPIVQDNLQKLRNFGMEIIEPETGQLACKDVGKGKMAKRFCWHFSYGTDDPVRYITNHSSGKMGYALANVAMRRGAEVTLVSGVTNLKPPIGVRLIQVVSAKEMFEAIKPLAKEQDIIIKAAAVADYTPDFVEPEKIKKHAEKLELSLGRTTDILAWLGENRREGQFICGFSMETENIEENSKEKLKKKRADMMVANNLRVEGAGFGFDTNVVTLIMKEGIIELPLMRKEEVATNILDVINHSI